LRNFVNKITWLRTLALSGLAVGAQKFAESAGAKAGGELGLAVMGAALGAGAVGDYLVNRAAAQREAQLNAAEHEELAARNHHLRHGMAGALRRGLHQAHLEIRDLPADPYHNLFRSWDTLLQQAETDANALERFFPAEFADSQWDATNAYSLNLDEDARALAGFLQELRKADQIYTHWTEDQALDFAGKALPYYQRAFADDLAGDSNGLLMQAFTVKGVNQIRAGVEALRDENRKLHAETHKTLLEIKDLVQPRPLELGQVRTWSLPLATDYFVGRNQFLNDLHQKLQAGRKVLIHAAGGQGKTQAALEYVKRFGGYYEDVAWVRASDERSLFESYREIASGLGLLRQDEPSDADVQRAVKSWLSQHPNVLLVFDNLDRPELAKAYWPAGGPMPFLLATSQKRDVSELERMARLPLNVWEPPEALQFLMERTGQTELNEVERTAAMRLAAETGYLPLALEQAGAYIAKDKVSFEQYLRTYLRVRLKLLEKQKPVAGDYKHSVATTWQASMERMPVAARELLAAVSHLAPNANPYELIGCAPECLGPVLQAALGDEAEADPLAALLGSLQEYSLVLVDRGTWRSPCTGCCRKWFGRIRQRSSGPNGWGVGSRCSISSCRKTPSTRRVLRTRADGRRLRRCLRVLMPNTRRPSARQAWQIRMLITSIIAAGGGKRNRWR
jgi:hypothetical protein